jgi:hypothetical protein
VILLVLYQACARLGTEEALELMGNVSRQMPKSYESNSKLITSLLDASMECGDVAYAELWFRRLPSRDLPIYGAMMKGKNILHHRSSQAPFFQDTAEISNRMKQSIYFIRSKILMELFSISSSMLVGRVVQKNHYN